MSTNVVYVRIMVWIWEWCDIVRAGRVVILSGGGYEGYEDARDARDAKGG